MWSQLNLLLIVSTKQVLLLFLYPVRLHLQSPSRHALDLRARKLWTSEWDRYAPLYLTVIYWFKVWMMGGRSRDETAWESGKSLSESIQNKGYTLPYCYPTCDCSITLCSLFIKTPTTRYPNGMSSSLVVMSPQITTHVKFYPFSLRLYTWPQYSIRHGHTNVP